MPRSFSSDLEQLVAIARGFPNEWDGRTCILEMKEGGGRNWKQMEWIGWYFEFLCKSRFAEVLAMPSERCLRCKFDGYGAVNWDFKAKAIKSDDHRAILNDKESMDLSIRTHGAHGIVLGLCDVEYNDDARTFQKWHTRLKGGTSAYEREREQRGALSRYRKTKAVLNEVQFLQVNARNVGRLDIHKQGRNSNGRPRPEKYMLNLETAGDMVVKTVALPDSC